MAPKKSVLADLFESRLWLIVSAGTTAVCLTLAVQVYRDPSFIPLNSARAKLIIVLCVIFGVPAGLYGIIATALLLSGANKIRVARRELTMLRRQLAELEKLRITQRSRIEELSTLREIAYVVNRESDFSIIAQKVLPLIADLLQPIEASIFLVEEPGGPVEPFAQYVGGKLLTGGKLRRRRMPDFSMHRLESHSIVCRVHDHVLHGIVPLKVDSDILGVLFLVFTADDRPAAMQVYEFNELRRVMVQEIAKHISLAVKTKHLRMKSIVDGLTQLYTKSHFTVQLAAHVALACRTGTGFSLIVCDLDHFKHVNDTHGHTTGDAVLVGVAQTVRRILRKYDSGYRTGGEELVVLLPDTNLAGAARVAERLRRRIENRRFKAEDGPNVQVTVSCGVARYRAGESAEDMFNRADRRLYAAKKGGRNRVVPQAA